MPLGFSKRFLQSIRYCKHYRFLWKWCETGSNRSYLESFSNTLYLSTMPLTQSLSVTKMLPCCKEKRWVRNRCAAAARGLNTTLKSAGFQKKHSQVLEQFETKQQDPWYTLPTTPESHWASTHKVSQDGTRSAHGQGGKIHFWSHSFC